MKETEFQFIVEDFKSFIVPARFNGGCKKTRLDMYCYRIKPDGEIGSLTENCENWSLCVGHKYNYKM